MSCGEPQTKINWYFFLFFFYKNTCASTHTQSHTCVHCFSQPLTCTEVPFTRGSQENCWIYLVNMCVPKLHFQMNLSSADTLLERNILLSQFFSLFLCGSALHLSDFPSRPLFPSLVTDPAASLSNWHSGIILKLVLGISCCVRWWV